MRDLLSSFHNANNGSLGFVIAVRGNTLVGLFVLLYSLLCLDLIDLDPIFRIRKVEVDTESVALINIFTLRGLT